MEGSNIELPGPEIDAIGYRDGRLRIRFSRAYIIKTMTSSLSVPGGGSVVT